MAAVSTMPPGGDYSDYQDDDGYFTCAVSVQHKKHENETSSAYSGYDSDQGRKVIWPAPANGRVSEKQTETIKTFQNTFKQANTVTSGVQQQVDQPHKWLQQQNNVSEERGSGQRVSRSRSRSKNILDRARSFERAAAESSRPGSRNGSHHRSPSANRGQMEELWKDVLERPGSRTDVDSRRFDEIGRVQTSDWEMRIKGQSMESLPTKTPPPKRKELNMKRNPDLDRNIETRTPEPPPPPTRMTYPPNTIRDTENDFPPPPVSEGSSKLSEESVGQICEENKENIVKQWVESTTKSAEEIAKELEKFAYDIAETVVSNMERSSEKKETRDTREVRGQSQIQSQSGTSSSIDQIHPTLYSDFWERQTSISTNENAQLVSQSNRNNTTNIENSNEIKRSASGSGLYFAAPAHTTRHELHGPIYVQEDNRRVGMTFQQEERRREEMRKQEEAKQEEKRRLQLEEQQRKAKEEEAMRLEYERQLMLKKQEEENRRQEEMRRAEEERIRQAEIKRQEEERRQLELRRQEEERRQMELKRQEEERRQLELKRQEEERRQQELKRQEEERRQEILRFEQLKKEEELKRQEELRLEQELRKQYEMQQQKMKLEQQQKLQQQQQMAEMSQQQSVSTREHIPKIPKNKTFEANQDRTDTKHEDHLLSIKTGQVNEKRNFWMRSTSVDRINNISSLSPAPRRRRIDWGAANRQKENDDPESRPGSSLGQANTGSVKNLSSGFLAKSKSSAAVHEIERGRPKQKSFVQNGWTKEKYDQETKKEFFKSQELKTNKVNDTVQSWGKRDGGATSGRSTPAPSRHIGDTFSENKIAKATTENKSANSWRTKTPEPTLKLVNVSVEKGAGSNQNIHISENAQKQMANFISSGSNNSIQQQQIEQSIQQIQQEQQLQIHQKQQQFQQQQQIQQQQSQVQQQQHQYKEECFYRNSNSFITSNNTNTMSSQSSVTSHGMSTSSRHSGAGDALSGNAPPPAPERNQSYGGKCENTISPSVVETAQTVNISEATSEKVAIVEKEDVTVPTSPIPANIEQSVVTSVVASVTANHVMTNMSQSSHLLQNSQSTQSINSVLSTCSSNALPVPVKAAWFDELEAVSTTSNFSTPVPEDSGVLSPTKTGKTPVPVVANWFDNLESKFNKALQPQRNEGSTAKTIQAASSELDDILDELIVADDDTSKDENADTLKSKQKIFMTDDADNISVRSDVTVIENTESNLANDEKTSLLVVPQSPKEIRKKFQNASSFEKSFTKSSEIEFSKEFKEGIRGKVRESRENFLKQTSQNAINPAQNNKNEELHLLKLQRAASQVKMDQEEGNQAAESIRNEKLMELEAVKRSRSKSRARDENEDLVQNSYSQEKRERELELMQLANRNANMTWQPENKEPSIAREERNRELAEIANRTIEYNETPEHEGQFIDEPNSEHGKYEEFLNIEQIEDDKMEMEDPDNYLSDIYQQAQELKQISSMRPKSPWRPQQDFRNTANAWREREKSASRDRDTPVKMTKEVPTRRIGNLFNRDPDYWNLNDTVDDLPEPPQSVVSEVLASPSPTPPTPKRQSSKGKIESYARDSQWNSSWRKC